MISTAVLEGKINVLSLSIYIIVFHALIFLLLLLFTFLAIVNIKSKGCVYRRGLRGREYGWVTQNGSKTPTFTYPTDPPPLAAKDVKIG